MLKQADGRVLDALVMLASRPEWDVVREWLTESREKTRASCEMNADDQPHERGGSLMLTQILRAVADAPQNRARQRT